MSRRSAAWVALITLWLGLAVPIAWRSSGEAVDDFFITYRFAQNLAEGQGFVFNPGERVFGTTAPGHGLMLAGLHVLTGVALEALGTASTLVAFLALALLVVRTSDRRPEAALGGTLVLTSPYLWLHNGSELPVALALLALAAALGPPAVPAGRGELPGRRSWLAGAIAGLAVWFRPDAGLAVAAEGVLRWWRRRSLPWRYGLAAAAVLAGGLGLAWAWFGQPLPATLEAKRFQAQWRPEVWRSGWDFWIGALRGLHRWYGAGLPLLAVVGALGLRPLWRRGGRVLRQLLLYGLGVAVAYPLLGVPFYPWYVLATFILWLYSLAFATGALARRCTTFFGPAVGSRLLASVAAAWLLVATLGGSFDQARWMWTRGLRNDLKVYYQAAGNWLQDQTRVDEEVAYVEVGMVAYYSRRPVHDLLGLVTAGAFEKLESRGLDGAFLDHPTPWVLCFDRLRGLQGPVCEAPWFQRAYEPAARFEKPGSEVYLRLYRRRAGAPLPIDSGHEHTP